VAWAIHSSYPSSGSLAKRARAAGIEKTAATIVQNDGDALSRLTPLCQVIPLPAGGSARSDTGGTPQSFLSFRAALSRGRRLKSNFCYEMRQLVSLILFGFLGACWGGGSFACDLLSTGLRVRSSLVIIHVVVEAT
jgi:hypothetical protein